MGPWLPLGQSWCRLLRFKTKARTYSAVNNSFEKQMLVGCSAPIETECLMTGGNPETYRLPCYHYVIPQSSASDQELMSSVRLMHQVTKLGGTAELQHPVEMLCMRLSTSTGLRFSRFLPLLHSLLSLNPPLGTQ